MASRMMRVALGVSAAGIRQASYAHGPSTSGTWIRSRTSVTGGQPADLGGAHRSRRIGDVIDGDEVSAFVVEGVVGGAEVLLVGRSSVQGSIVLAGHEAPLPARQAGDDPPEFGHPAVADRHVV